MPYYEATLHINRIYAFRHGYTFLHQKPRERAQPDRHAAWLKLQTIADKLQCCCQWVFWIDSDSFMVMQDHKLSIEAWLGKQTDHRSITTLLGNMYSIPGPGIREGSDPVALIADNAPYQAIDFFCTGNMLFTRTQRTFDILDYWFNKSVSVLDNYMYTHPWEQANFNRLVMPTYREAFWVASSGDFNSKDGDIIRHLWHPYGDEYRTEQSLTHLKHVMDHSTSMAHMHSPVGSSLEQSLLQ